MKCIPFSNKYFTLKRQIAETASSQILRTLTVKKKTFELRTKLNQPDMILNTRYTEAPNSNFFE